MAISKVSPEDFVRAWQVADGMKAVMKITGLSYVAVTRRASEYRKHGVRLKRMPTPRKTIDVDALNKICESTAENKQ